MALRGGRQEDAGSDKWIEVSASMTGTLAFKDPVNLRISGQFDGTLDTKGNLSIAERANVTATIHGEVITISGTSTGNITATGRVELQSTARVSGKISTPRLIVQDGAILQGSIEMSGGGVGSPWMTVEELARYLEVEAGTVSQWAQSGRLPGARNGSEWRFERLKIEDWLAHEKIK